ncbi:hypothetical protein B0H14DRAFT_3872932 [Mycena olivaceomarginata]|nr:hypothetical protein B0H14DRAFT_3872932 [Mycena olivaceomarginata]
MSVSSDKMCTGSRAKFPGSPPLSTLDTFGTTESLDVDCHKPPAFSHSTPVTRVGEEYLDVKKREQSGELNVRTVKKPRYDHVPEGNQSRLKLKQTARRTRTSLTQVSDRKNVMAGTKVLHSSLVDALNYAATRNGSK